MDKKIEVNGYSVDRAIVDEVHEWRDPMSWVFQEYSSKIDAWTLGWMEAAVKNYKSTGSRGPAVSEPKGSKIVVDFNRRLTAAEKFDLRRSLPKDYFKVVIHTQEYEVPVDAIPDYDNQYTTITVTSFNSGSYDDPVSLVKAIADMVENNFLNVYPRSVHTIYPRFDK